MNKKSLLIVLFLFVAINLFSNNELDSLKKALKSSDDPNKSELIFKFYSRNDSLSNSIEFLSLAAKNTVDKNFEIYYQIKKSAIFIEKNYFTRASNLIDSCIIESEKLKNDSLTAMCYFNKAEIFHLESNYQEAIINYYNALRNYEKANSDDDIINCYNSIGGIYIDFNDSINYMKAINVFRRAKQIANKNKELQDKYVSLINNLGVAYDGIGENEIALNYYIEYYKHAKEKNIISDIILSTLNIGDSYRILGDYQKAIEYTNICLQFSEKYNILKYYYFATSNLAEIFNEIGESQKALILLKKIKSDIIKLQDNSLSQFYLDLLAKVYYNIGNFKESAETYKFYNEFKDSVFSIEAKLQVSEFEAKYDNEKKEQKILLLEKNNELNQIQNKRQALIRNSFIIGFVLMILLAFTIFKAYRTKRKDNNLLLLKNNEIQQQKEEIQTQSENLAQANIAITNQKDKIESIHIELTSSILYAKRIQQALLPDFKILEINDSKQPFSDYFVLYKPKDVVSGDFYWSTKINDWFIICVADCTGHGVPGAFMSLLGISFLNEIVRKNEVTKASEVLNNLRNAIIDSLKQTGEVSFGLTSNSMKDGMDISLVAINTQAQSPKSQIPSSKLQEEESKQFSVSSKQSADNFTELQSCEMRCIEPVETFKEKESTNNKDLSSKSQIPNSKVQGNDEYFDKLSTSQLNIRTIEHANHELQTTTELASSTKLNNKQSYLAQWAGANNPLWIVRSEVDLTTFEKLSNLEVRDTDFSNFKNLKNLEEHTSQRLVLHELKPDKMPIAIYDKMESFTNHEFQLESGDCIYLMSDGYQDQFGGLNNKKVLSKNLKQMLIAHSQLPMEEQKQKLENTLTNWIGNGEQIDDITILGLKI